MLNGTINGVNLISSLKGVPSQSSEPDYQSAMNVLQKGNTLTLRRYNKQENYWRVDVNGVKLRAKVYIDVQMEKRVSVNNSPRLACPGIGPNCTVADLLKYTISPFIRPEQPTNNIASTSVVTTTNVGIGGTITVGSQGVSMGLGGIVGTASGGGSTTLKKTHHPKVIPEITKKILNDEIKSLYTEFQELQAEWNLLVKIYNQEFVTDPSSEHPDVIYKPKPPDLIFKKMLQNPYQPVMLPQTFLHETKKKAVAADAEPNNSTTTTTPNNTTGNTNVSNSNLNSNTNINNPTSNNTNTNTTSNTTPSSNSNSNTTVNVTPSSINTSNVHNKKKSEEHLKEFDKDSINKEKDTTDNIKETSTEESSSEEDMDGQKNLTSTSKILNNSSTQIIVANEKEIGALAPVRCFRYLDLLTSELNPGSIPEKQLEELNTLNFDVFPYKDTDNEDFLILLTMQMFYRLGLVEQFKISEVTLFRFLKTIALRYRYVPFHNFYHAWNVTQTMYSFFQSCSAGNWLTPEEKISLIVASLCHDCDHPGLNNSFQQKASTRVSILHKKSILENHHLLQCMNILEQPECNILLKATEQERKLIIRHVGRLVLATDLALHGVIHLKLLDRKKLFAKYTKMVDSKQIIDTSLLGEDDRSLLMCCLIKCADLSNEIRPTHMAQKWAKLVITEFFMQSEKEKELDLPVTTFMDKQKVIIAKEQINFIEKLCLPLYEPLTAIFPALSICTKQLSTNRNEWNARLLNFFSNDINSIKKLSNISIWEREQVKGKKWEKKNFLTLLSSRST